MKTFKRILLAVVVLMVNLIINSCGTIHQYPNEGEEVDPTLVNLNLRLFADNVIEDAPASNGSKSSDRYDVRYVIEMYSNYTQGADNTPVERIVKTFAGNGEGFPEQVDFSLQLRARKYTFLVWVDYVDAGSKADKYYSTDGFPAVVIKNPYVGNDDSRDVLSSFVNVDLTKYAGVRDVYLDHDVQLERPVGKYRIITTDLDKFVSKVTKADGTKAISLDEVKIKYIYKGFMPSGYDITTGAPSGDAETGVSYNSRIVSLGNGEADLGSDFIFASNNQTYIELTIEIYDKNDNLIHRTDIRPTLRGISIDKGKLTTVKGEFLTKDFVPGVGIDPDFDGEDTWYIDDNGNIVKV